MLDRAGVAGFLAKFGSYATPYYREFKPDADLSAYVACTWVRVVRHTAKLLVAPIIPDGCADIMVYDDQPPQVAGPDATTRWTSLADGAVITGIRLRPGAARAVFGCPASLIVNGRLLLGDLSTGATYLHEELLAAGDLQRRHHALSNWVRAALARANAHDTAVVDACSTLIHDPGAEIGPLARRLDWSPRTLHRQFVAACGYGPKHFQRIMRVQTAIRAMHSHPKTGFAAVAAKAGYADQAHMTRDFRSITGFTPASYVATSLPDVGAWISEEWRSADAR
jgi:AraC-like DNA-binding protein